MGRLVLVCPASVRRTLSLAVLMAAPGGAIGQSTAPAPVQLPAHADDPVNAGLKDDPILAIGRATQPTAMLSDVVRRTVGRAPSAAEAIARADEASAAVDEAKAARLPSADFSISSYRVISRQFGNNIENVIERNRPNRRTDLLLSADQLLIDAGGTRARIEAARQRLQSAQDDVESAADRVALDTIGAWYDVFTYRSLVALGEAFSASQRDLKQMVSQRVERGVSAPADLSRVDSYIASADTRLARFRRQAASAEARFAALTGEPAPTTLARTAFPVGAMSRDFVVAKANSIPAVRAARAAAAAAARDAKATRADMYPTIGVGIDAGRYGIYETPYDYDVRGRVTLRARISGVGLARTRQAEARARGADARADGVATDAARDAEIAWSDVQALEEQLSSLEATYVASRRSRDVVAERFRVSSGTLFDVLGAEDSYFETAASYLQALTELDAARYVLLSRTGTLLPTLGVNPPEGKFDR